MEKPFFCGGRFHHAVGPDTALSSQPAGLNVCSKRLESSFSI